jgi:parallel beta-helix repeat protein
MKNAIFGISLALLLVSALGLSSGIHLIQAYPSTVYVDDDNIAGPWDGTPQHPYQNITSGLAYALSGDTVFVFNGTYYEQLKIAMPVNLEGQDRYATIIDGNQTGDTITISTDSVRISGFTVQNSNLTSGNGIYLSASDGSNVSFNIISSSYTGIRLYDAMNNTLSNNYVYNNSYGISLSASHQNLLTGNNVTSNIESGISITDSNKVTVSASNASNNNWGLFLISSYECTLTGNTFSSNSMDGLYIFNSVNNTFLNNGISSNNDLGVWLSKSTNNFLADNEISANLRFGIYIGNSTLNTVAENTISMSDQFGIRLDYSDNNTISGNTLLENQVRGTLLFYANNNTFLHNNFINNTGTLASINSTNIFDNGIEGNFWNDYNGSDENQDGVGDTPYVIDAYNQDNYPLMGAFTDFAVPYQEVTYHIFTVCNSTISDFQFNETVRMLSFMVDNNMSGFCRITIPERLISSPYEILVDNAETNATRLSPSNITHTCLYFAYNNSAQEIKIVSKAYYELLSKYDTLFESYQALNTTLSQTLAEYDLLNQTYQQTLASYTQLINEYDILNQTYWQTLSNYTTLQGDYTSLNATYNQILANYTMLLDNFTTLNETYQETLTNYATLRTDYLLLQNDYTLLNNTYTLALANNTELTTNYNVLNHTYEELLINYTGLKLTQDTMNHTYQQLLANNTQLQGNYGSLQVAYSSLLEQYNLLNATYNRLASDNSLVRTILWCVSIAFAVLIIVAPSLTLRYRGKFKAQKKLAEQYRTELERISLLDNARIQFEDDVQRRKTKIEEFQNKYGFKVQPRDSLDDVFADLEIRKRKENR